MNYKKESWKTIVQDWYKNKHIRKIKIFEGSVQKIWKIHKNCLFTYKKNYEQPL